MVRARLNEAHAQVDFLRQGVRLLLASTIKTPAAYSRMVVTEEGLADHTPGMAIDGLVLETEAAQQLFEEMWAQGFRSVHDRDAGDRVDAARREHIEDLRKAAKLK